jgi:hypothetical protein
LNIATQDIDRKNFAAAETPLRRALAIREKVFGTDHVAVAQVKSQLANSLMDKNDMRKPETSTSPCYPFRSALSVRSLKSIWNRWSNTPLFCAV